MVEEDGIKDTPLRCATQNDADKAPVNANIGEAHASRDNKVDFANPRVIVGSAKEIEVGKQVRVSQDITFDISAPRSHKNSGESSLLTEPKLVEQAAPATEEKLQSPISPSKRNSECPEWRLRWLQLRRPGASSRGVEGRLYCRWPSIGASNRGQEAWRKRGAGRDSRRE